MTNWDELAVILQDNELIGLRDDIYLKMENYKNPKWKMMDIIHDSAKEWQKYNPLLQTEIV